MVRLLSEGSLIQNSHLIVKVDFGQMAVKLWAFEDSHFPGLPRSWKNHGISGTLKFSEISGKVLEFLLKLGRVMEKSWNFEIGAKSH